MNPDYNLNTKPMKIGDYLLCKTSLSYTLHQGAYYKILNIEEKSNEQIFTIQYSVINEISFSLNNRHYYYLWKFFYTPKEMRNLKLQQLYNLP